MTHARPGTSAKWRNADAIWRGLALLPLERRGRTDLHEMVRFMSLGLATVLFLSTSALVVRANKPSKPMASVAATDCVVVAAEFKNLRQ